MPKFSVERSIEISKTPEEVYESVVDFGTWTKWSPWLCMEPDATVTVTPDRSSVGSVYAWDGDVVGAGEIEHQTLDPNRHIEEEIRFSKPFASKSKVEFEFVAVPNGTRLTWRMSGSLPWFLFWMTSQMESFIGMDYERGLKMFKEWIETGDVLSTTTVHGIASVGPLQVAGVRKQCHRDEIGSAMTGAFEEATRLLAQHVSSPCGEMVSVYHCFDIKKQTFDFTSGVVLPEMLDTLPPSLSRWSLPACDALHVTHIGSYEHLGNAWSAVHAHARAKKRKPSKLGSYEVYKNNPQDTDPSELRTEIYLPLR
ncbi:SRPBCC family protein [Aureliella helgolandensis]|uniref:Bacterial transcription activator, effector binding domain n=1 Tax=Aureliella helgolandensis TaxID=2527968 RepID=A0A518G621_9BACT|nr:SRPBCC family protein [Aureliella helgolandensis]QDV24035.1 Bacterial transcription activator, effector binding domain [Aureliella helgolandensis]